MTDFIDKHLWAIVTILSFIFFALVLWGIAA